VQIGHVIEQMGKFYPEVKLAYAVRGNRCKNVLALMMRKMYNYITLPSTDCYTFFWGLKNIPE
jgi:hypothetical protein